MSGKAIRPCGCRPLPMTLHRQRQKHAQLLLNLLQKGGGEGWAVTGTGIQPGQVHERLADEA